MLIQNLAGTTPQRYTASTKAAPAQDSVPQGETFVEGGAALPPSSSPQLTFSRSAEAPAKVARPQFEAGRADAPKSGILAKMGWLTSVRTAAVVGMGVACLALAGCNDSTPTPGPAPAPPAVTATTLTQRLSDLKDKDAAGYASMAEAGYYKQLLENIAKQAPDASAKAGTETPQQIAQKTLKAFDFKGSPEAQQQLTTDGLKAIVDAGPGVDHDVAVAVLAMGGEFHKGLANAPSGYMAQIKAPIYDKALDAVISNLPGLPASITAKTGLPASVAQGYADTYTLEAQTAKDYEGVAKDDGLTVVLCESTANGLYNQVSTNAQIANTQFGSAISLLKNVKMPF